MHILFVLLAVIVGYLYLQTGFTQSHQSRYQIVTAQGRQAVFRIDTTTGVVSYCYPYDISASNPNPESMYCTTKQAK
jgi:hypothetical protein